MDLADLISCKLYDSFPEYVQAVMSQNDDDDWVERWENEIREILTKLNVNRERNEKGQWVNL